MYNFYAAPKQKQNVKDVLKEFRQRLVKVLPMEDTYFITNLDTADLLPGNTKDKVQSASLPTRADKASHFLDNVILPDVDNNRSNLDKLLNVMEESDFGVLNGLGTEIQRALDAQ